MTEITERLKVAIADRYVIERELGAGGMATVYLAHDVKHDRKVALKVLRPELAAVIGAERFLQEIKVTANLQHSHILPLYDSGAADNFLFYVMPYVEGETLRTKLDREKQLGIDDAVTLARAIAGALEYAHKRGVVHRDIKPENILLRENDPLIADFGIALAVSHAGGNRLTETGLSVGTPHYMSPEQAMGDRELDARSDIYSLGAVLYEMLTGEPPYTGSTAQAIVARVITEEPRAITLQRRTVPPHVADAVHKALNKLPADRFSTAASFAEALVTPGYVTPTHVRTGVHQAAGARLPLVRRYLWPAVAGALAALLVWNWVQPGDRPVVARYGLAFPPGQEPEDGNHPTFALAPDASWIVYDGTAPQGFQLWVKERHAYHAVPLPGSDWPGTSSGSAPAVSPDGHWIAHLVPGPGGASLRKLPRGGGSAITVTDSVA
ncbi:MAG: serine/threonine-protein kinase, partial [Gemmatimonadales bacterium]